MSFSYTVVVPVYNRPDELRDLLESFCTQVNPPEYDILIVEDGSVFTSEDVVAKFRPELPLAYYKKPNTGPGDSRNYGSERAKGDYILYLDSDCILPPHYLFAVDEFLKTNPVACFGGKDAAMPKFSDFQKGVNHVMTSFLTTGGIRGKKHTVSKFQPRSFNMGISRAVFEKIGGFRNIHPGEDPDLAIRIQKIGLDTAYSERAFVYHKRRTSWKAFANQVYKFGLSRAVLNHWHPQSSKWVYHIPGLFLIAFVLSIVFLMLSKPYFLALFLGYWGVLFLESFVRNKSLAVAAISVPLSGIQLFGYGYGFLKGMLILFFRRKTPAENLFPILFWPKKQR